MQVTQEKRPGSRIGLTIVVEADQVKRAYEKTLGQLSRSVQIRGFRKGKAPRNLVLREVGRDRVRATVLDDLIGDAVEKTLEENSIRPITSFELESGIDELISNFSPEADLSFRGYVEVYPEAEVGQYKGLTVSPTRVDADLSQVEATIDQWRERRATLLPVEDRPAALGDVAVIDFQGYDLEGNELEGISASDFELELKEENFIPGFVVGMVDMALDEVRDVEADFPEDYFNEKLAGQKAKFSITLHELKMKELPEVDDGFAQEISGGDLQTVVELRTYLEERLNKEALDQSEANLEEAILASIVESTEVELPASLIQQETSQMLAQGINSLQQGGNMQVGDVRKFIADLPEETRRSLEEKYRPEAITRLKRTLALGRIVKEEEVSVGETELEMEVRDFFGRYGSQGQKLDPKRVQQVVHEELLTGKVMSFLRSQTTVNWVDGEGNPVEAPALEQLEEPESQVSEAEFTDPETTDPETTDPEATDPEVTPAEAETIEVSAEAEIEGEGEADANREEEIESETEAAADADAESVES